RQLEFTFLRTRDRIEACSPASTFNAVRVLDSHFATASLTLGVILRAKNHLPALESFSRRVWILLGLAFAGLMGNYVVYAKALQHSSPRIAQTVGQLGPMFLLFGGLIVFHEHFS